MGMASSCPFFLYGRMNSMKAKSILEAAANELDGFEPTTAIPDVFDKIGQKLGDLTKRRNFCGKAHSNFPAA